MLERDTISTAASESAMSRVYSPWREASTWEASRRQRDAVAAGVGMVSFWPTAKRLRSLRLEAAAMADTVTSNLSAMLPNVSPALTT